MWIALMVSGALNGMSQTSELYESFSINSTECNRLTTVSGTTFMVPENAFTCSGELQIQFAEIDKPSEMILLGVSMRTADGVLESSGMFHIKATCDTKEIELNQGAELEVNLVQSEVSSTEGIDQYFVPSDGMGHESLWSKTESGVETFNDQPSKDNWGGPGQQDLRYYIPFEEGDWEDDNWDGADNWTSSEEVNRDALGMKEVDSLTYANYMAEQEAKKRREAAREKAYQNMKIDQMGWYNCDRLIQEETEQFIVKVLADGKKYEGSIHVVYEGLNSVITYHVSKKSSATILMIKDREAKVFLISDEGEIYLSKGELLKEDKAKWEFVSIEQPAGSAAELSKAVGIR